MTERDRLAPHSTLRSYYEVDESRQSFVNDLFDRGSRDYDWVNQVLSFGSGYWYRGEVLRRAGLAEGMSVVDVATGTGPVAAVARAIVKDSGAVIGIDPSGGMLRVARHNAVAAFVQAVGERLPLHSNTFDMLTMGYALRHVSDLRAAFQEYHRVLKPGGQLVIMEICVPRSKLGARALGFYMGTIAPLVTRIGTGRRDSARMVRYYWDTTAACVPPEEIVAALRDAGFREARREVRYAIMAEYRGLK